MLTRGVHAAPRRAVPSASLLTAVLLAACTADALTAQRRSGEGAESAVKDQTTAPLSASTSAVLDRNMRAFAARDVDALMDSYTDQSVLIAQEAVYQGKAGIRDFFEHLIKEFASPKTTMTMHQRRVHGPVAFIAWTAETPTRRYELGTDTFYIANGRILYQTFAFKAASAK